jgi:phage baseplate assembly protein W
MRYINIKFPIVDDKQLNSFFGLNTVTKNAYSSNLLLLLLTEKGERYYNPDYGTNLLKYIFEPSDDISASSVQKEIKQTVSKYIPELTISEVDFIYKDGENEVEAGQGHELNVVIKFVYSEDSFKEEGVLELTF